jgi:hypothetical protein
MLFAERVLGIMSRRVSPTKNSNGRTFSFFVVVISVGMELVEEEVGLVEEEEVEEVEMEG